MNYDAFLKNYATSTICRIKKNDVTSSLLVKSSNKHGKVFRVKVSKKGDYYFCID